MSLTLLPPRRAVLLEVLESLFVPSSYLSDAYAGICLITSLETLSSVVSNGVDDGVDG
jgi:hypothetical protein